MSLRDRLRSADWYRISVIVLLLGILLQVNDAKESAQAARTNAGRALDMAELAAEAAKHAGEKAEQAVSDLEVSGVQCSR